jgi:hypothetical protein
MNEWISVKDRLPKEDGDYLTYVIDNGCCYHMDVQRFSKVGRKEKGMYSDVLLHWEKEFWDDNFVTHWIDIPEPPHE